MVGALGVNQAWLFTAVFALGAVLAGLGGALQIPREPANLDSTSRDRRRLRGRGRRRHGQHPRRLPRGAADRRGQGVLHRPPVGSALVLEAHAGGRVRRHGGRAGAAALGPARQAAGEAARRGEAPTAAAAAARAGRSRRSAASRARAGAAARRPAMSRVLLIDIVCFALFAASLHFIMGPGGMVSFGHAAYFGLGAYAARAAVQEGRLADGGGARRWRRSSPALAPWSSAGSACACRASISPC